MTRAGVILAEEITTGLWYQRRGRWWLRQWPVRRTRWVTPSGGFESLPSPPISTDNPDMGNPMITNFNLVQAAGRPLRNDGSGI